MAAKKRVTRKAAKSARSTRVVPPAQAEQPKSAWRPNRATAPVEYVADAIKDRIRSGRLAAGQRLIEADLCAELNVKRGPVREALRILAGEGILELIAQRGARVRQLSITDLGEMMPVMAGLVATSIRLSIGKLRKASVRGELEQYMAQMRYSAANRDLHQFQLAGMRYQEALQRAADNRYLDYLRSKLHSDLLYHQIPIGMRIENWKSYLRHFDQVHDALLSGDESRAVALIYEHEARLGELFKTGENPAVWK